MVLQKFRDRLTGIMAIFIVGLLAIPFALVGVNSYFSPDSENTVAMVNDEGITLTEYNTSFQNYRERMRSLMGEAYDAQRFDDPVIRRQHLDTMIERELLRQVAAESGLSVDNQFLAQAIREIPGFQVDGEFNSEVYQSQLSAQGLTPPAFENQMRASMVLSQYPQTISASAIATPREVEQYIRLQQQERAFAALVVSADSERDEPADETAAEADANVEIEEPAAEISQQRIQAWYDDHADQFRRPERVVVEYIELDASQLASEEPIDEDTLRQQFEEQSARFISPEAHSLRIS